MTDLLLVSLGTTRGLRLADAELVEMVRAAGASVAAVGTRIGWTNALRRAYPVNDAVEAIAARRALAAGLRRHQPRSVVFSTTTAALLAGDPGCRSPCGSTRRRASTAPVAPARSSIHSNAGSCLARD